MRRAGTFILDLLAPRRCTCCRRYDTWLCARCRDGLLRAARKEQQHCHVCKRTPTPYGNCCGACRGTTPLRSIFVALPLRGADKRTLLRSVHHYKYHFVRALGADLGALCAAALAHAALPLPDMVVPVPLHARRERWRGFNQAALLAHILCTHTAHALALPLASTALVRVRATRPQVRAGTRAQRRRNLRGAFRVPDPRVVRGKRILLVDDIATTGSTLERCAAVLKRAGARSVDAIVLTRGGAAH